MHPCVNISHVFYMVPIEKSLNLLIISDFTGQEIYNLSNFDFYSKIYMRLPLLGPLCLCNK